MDTDWCLSCGQHLTTDAPYCSAACLNRDRPIISSSPFHTRNSSFHTLSDSAEGSVVYHHIEEVPKAKWPASNYDGIRAWAASVPSGSSPGVSLFSTPESSTPSSRASSPHPAPSMRTPAARKHRLPKLLEARPMAPSLCMSTPKPSLPRPSMPIQTPQQSIASLHLPRPRSAADSSMSVSSLLSGITESLVATPSSLSLADPLPKAHAHPRHAPHLLEAVATHVRSWVSPSPLSKPLKKHSALDTVLYSAYDEDEDAGAHAWWASEGKSASLAPAARAPVHSLAQHFQAALKAQDAPAPRGRRAPKACA